MVYRLSVALFIVGLIGSPVNAGPFGLTMGMSKSEIDNACGVIAEPLEGSPCLFYTETVPKPHSAFEGYALLVPPSTGLCQIRAISKDVHTSSHGLQLRTQFEALREALVKKYGACDELDTLLTGSIWNEPEDFMMGLLKRERFLRAEWDFRPNSESNSEIARITLGAEAKSRDTGWLLLQYNLSNHDEGQAALEDLEDDSL